MSKSLFRFGSAIVLVIFGLSVTASLAAPNPSFSCSKRMSPDEKAICQDPRLTKLDQIANQGYLFLRAKLGKAQANKLNLPLIRQRQKCKSDAVCIEKAQLESIRIFNQNGARLEIPDSVPDATVLREQDAPAARAELSPAPPPPPEPAPSSEPPTSAGNPETGAAEPAPRMEPSRPSEPTTTPEKSLPPTEEATAATPTSPPSATTPEAEGAPEAETRKAETADAPQEPVDQPPAESEGTTAAKDNGPTPDAGAAVAEATPEPKGSREWRPEIEKEIRAESELESSATDALSEEMAELEKIKPLSRQQKEALVSTRSRHRTAFILAGILFALVVAYAISKYRRDPGIPAKTAKPATQTIDPAATLNRSNSPPTMPSPLPAVRTKSTEPVAASRPTLPTASAQQPPGAWVWSQYKGKI